MVRCGGQGRAKTERLRTCSGTASRFDDCQKDRGKCCHARSYEEGQSSSVISDFRDFASNIFISLSCSGSPICTMGPQYPHIYPSGNGNGKRRSVSVGIWFFIFTHLRIYTYWLQLMHIFVARQMPSSCHTSTDILMTSRSSLFVYLRARRLSDRGVSMHK